MPHIRALSWIPCINYISRDHPNAHELTNHIPHPSPAHPACGHRVHPERRCAGGTEWFRCLQQVQLQVFPEYFEWGWRREQASCNQARTQLESPQIPANLNQIISIIAIIDIIRIIVIIDIITILRIIVGFQRRNKCTFERLRASVCRCRSWEQE